MESLVLSSGGNRGIMYGGVVRFLERNGTLQKIHTFVGSSIGALFATLLAIGYTSAEIDNVIMTNNLKDMLPTDEFEITNMLYKFALYSHNNMEKLVRKLVSDKLELPNITFAQLYKFFKVTLVVTACCLNTSQTEYFSRQTAPDMSVVTAVCMSMTIPFLFEPYLMDGFHYVDGSVFGHTLPTESKLCKDKSTLYVRICSKFKLIKINSVLEYIRALAGSFVRTDSERANVLWIETTVAPFDEMIGATEKRKLMHHAYERTKAWFREDFACIVRS